MKKCNLIMVRGWSLLVIFWSVASLQGQVGPNLVTWLPIPDIGNTYSTLAFSTGSNSVRLQQVYDATGFTETGYGGPFLITTIAFREDENHQHGFLSRFPDFQINLSTTPRAVDGLSESFDANVGINDSAIVPRGAFSLGASSLAEFGIIIFLSTPYYYDPSKGNLLLDIRNYGGGSTSWGDPPFAGLAFVDAASVTGDRVSSVVGNSVGAASGTTSTLGLVTQFNYNSVPEPSSLALIVVGLSSVLVWKHRRKQKMGNHCHVTP